MSELPEGWAAARLGDIASIQLGKMLDRAKHTRGTPLPYLRNVNVRWDAFELDDLREMPFQSGELSRFDVRRGDLFVCEGGEPGRSAVWSSPDSPNLKFQKALLRVRPRGGIEPRWIMYALQLAALTGELESYFTGSTIKHFPREAAAKFELLIAPLAEQRRIVAKVEALLEAVARAIQRVNRVEGSARTTKEAAIRTMTDLEDTPSVPLSRLGRWLSGGTPTRDRAEYWTGGRVPWVSPKDMKRDFLFDSQEYVTQGTIDSGAARLLPPGCVLVVVRGMILAHSLPVAVNRVPVAINQDIRALVPGPSVETDFVLRTLQAKRIEILERVKESTHGTRRLESADLFSVEIPLPDSDVQRKIAQRIAELLEKTDNVEKHVVSSLARMELAHQSILSAAFAGKLVPTEAELARKEGQIYEPASVRLERIRAQREQPDTEHSRRSSAMRRGVRVPSSRR